MLSARAVAALSEGNAGEIPGDRRHGVFDVDVEGEVRRFGVDVGTGAGGVSNLIDDGIFFLDCYGGWESQEVMEEEREIEVDGQENAFTYVWDQSYYNPINSACVNHIHFRFNDGSKMEKAFTYEWRLWQLAELVELLNEAGFSNVDTLWEDEDEDGEELGTHSVLTEIENQPGWLCYIVAER